MTQFEEPEFEPPHVQPDDEAGDPAEAFEALRQTSRISPAISPEK